METPEESCSGPDVRPGESDRRHIFTHNIWNKYQENSRRQVEREAGSVLREKLASTVQSARETE